MERFPYDITDHRKIIGKPNTYKGWTIWHYKLRCQQTGSKFVEWRDMTLATRKGAILVGCAYQLIDSLKEELNAPTS